MPLSMRRENFLVCFIIRVRSILNTPSRKDDCKEYQKEDYFFHIHSFAENEKKELSIFSRYQDIWAKASAATERCFMKFFEK